MAKHNCATCKFRAKYDRNAKSLIGRLWRWHANWCPGFKAYMNSLPAEERQAVAHQYRLTNYLKEI
jgi:hypothetical protein